MQAKERDPVVAICLLAAMADGARSVVEQAQFKLRGNNNALAWLAVVDRAEVLAQRGTSADKVQSAQLATQILAKLSPSFDPASPVIARLKQMAAAVEKISN